jgi:hypothetical protein
MYNCQVFAIFLPVSIEILIKGLQTKSNLQNCIQTFFLFPLEKRVKSSQDESEHFWFFDVVEINIFFCYKITFILNIQIAYESTLKSSKNKYKEKRLIS